MGGMGINLLNWFSQGCMAIDKEVSVEASLSIKAGGRG